MANISLRNVDEETTSRLKEEANRQGVSVNTLILHLIRQGLGLKARAPRRRVYHDLDHLAGTWSDEEAAEFMNSEADFETVDEELWQ